MAGAGGGEKGTRQEDRAELRPAQRQLHSRDEAQRIEGIERLRALHGVESAKVIVAVGLVNSSGDVRHAPTAPVRRKDDLEVGASCCGRSTASRGRGKGPLAAFR